MSAPIVVVGGGLAAGTFVTRAARARLRRRRRRCSPTRPHAPYERPPLSKDLLLGKGTRRRRRWSTRRRGTPSTASTCAPARPSTAIDLGRPHACRRAASGSTYDRLRARHRRPAAPPAAGRRLRRPRRLPAHARRLARAQRAAHAPAPASASSAAAGSGSRSPPPPGRPAPRSPSSRPSSSRCCACSAPRWRALFAELHREHGRRPAHRRPDRRRSPMTADGATVRLGDGDALAVDLLVVGVGVAAQTELAAAAGLAVDNGIRTDARLRTSAPDVYRHRRRRQRRPPGARPPGSASSTGTPRSSTASRWPPTSSAAHDRRRRTPLLLHRPVRPRHGVRRQPRARTATTGSCSPATRPVEGGCSAPGGCAATRSSPACTSTTGTRSTRSASWSAPRPTTPSCIADAGLAVLVACNRPIAGDTPCSTTACPPPTVGYTPDIQPATVGSFCNASATACCSSASSQLWSTISPRR